MPKQIDIGVFRKTSKFTFWYGICAFGATEWPMTLDNSRKEKKWEKAKGVHLFLVMTITCAKFYFPTLKTHGALSV